MGEREIGSRDGRDWPQMEVQEIHLVSGGQCQNVQTLKVGRCVKSLWRFF